MIRLKNSKLEGAENLLLIMQNRQWLISSEGEVIIAMTKCWGHYLICTEKLKGALRSLKKPFSVII